MPVYGLSGPPLNSELGALSPRNQVTPCRLTRFPNRAEWISSFNGNPDLWQLLKRNKPDSQLSAEQAYPERMKNKDPHLLSNLPAYSEDGAVHAVVEAPRVHW